MKKLLLACTLTFSMIGSAYADDASDGNDDGGLLFNRGGNPEEYLCDRQGQPLSAADVDPIAQATLGFLGYDANDPVNLAIGRPIAEEAVSNHNAGANCSENANNNNGALHWACARRCR
jgi:hypothetical protein